MTTFDNRERAFEEKFAHDAEIAFKVTARRNYLLGQWAGRAMGLSGQRLEDYAASVVRSEFTEAGDADVVRKLARDLADAGAATTEAQVRDRMDALLPLARSQVQAAK